MNWMYDSFSEQPDIKEGIKERRNMRRVELGANLKHVRQTRGWTQEQVALVLGYSRSHIHRVEQGITELGVADLEVLAERFGVPLSRLIHGLFEETNRGY